MNRFYVPFLLAPFAVQLVILIATAKRFRPLRFAVPILAGVASIIAVPQYCSFALKDSEGIVLFFGIFAVLTAIILWLILASLVLAGWGLAWPVYYLVYYLIEARSRREQRGWSGARASAGPRSGPQTSPSRSEAARREQAKRDKKKEQTTLT